MNVTLVFLGSRGDVQPGVALGKRLMARGHAARLVAPARFADLAHAHDLDFVPLAPDPQEILRQQQDKVLRGGGRMTLSVVIDLVQRLAPYFDEVANEMARACQASDVLVHSHLGELVVYSVAELLGIPTIAAGCQPNAPSRQLPVTGARELPVWLGRARQPYNALTHTLLQQLRWQFVRRSSNRWRAAHGLPPVALLGPYAHLYSGERPVLLAYSDTLVPRPTDYPGWVYSTGFWFLEHPASWRPPDLLVDFLEAGPEPVFVSLGSATIPGTAPILDTATGALRRSKLRGIIVDPTAEESAGRITDDILVVRDVPYDWLLPRVSLAVHAAGSGTTGSVLRAGLRSVPVPVQADQSFWASRMHALGVAVPALRLKQLTVESLSTAVTRALANDAMGRRATELGGKIRAEDGVERAVAVIHREVDRVRRRDSTARAPA